MRAAGKTWTVLLCVAVGPLAGCGARSALVDTLAAGGAEGAEGGAGDGSGGDGAGKEGGPGKGTPAVNLDVSGDSLAPSLLFDASHTAHLLYSYSELNTGVFPGGARYAECPGNCDVLSSWKFATLHAQGMVSALVLDSRGRPRFLFTQSDASQALGTLILASCDEGCTTASSWTFTTIATGLDLSNCTFGVGNIPVGMPLAIDSADRLWAVFSLSATNLAVASCATGCSAASGWVSTTYSYAGAEATNCPRDLAVDAAGTLHLTTAWSHLGTYAELAPGASAWSVYTVPFSFGYPFRMRIDATARPRILHAKGGTGNELATNGMVYASCDADCAMGGGWSSVTIPVSGGTAVPGDFVLDGAGNPHIAYASPSGAVLWGNENGGDCKSSSMRFQSLEYATITVPSGEPPGAWQFATVQTSSVLRLDTPMLGSGDNGNGQPLLAVGPTAIGIDTSGGNHFAFDLSKADACPADSFGNGCPDGLRYASLRE
jgi:hypothetical protein